MISKTILKQPNYLQTIILVTVWVLGNIWTWQWFIESLKNSSFSNLITLGIVIAVLLIQLGRNDFLQVESSTPRL